MIGMVISTSMDLVPLSTATAIPKRRAGTSIAPFKKTDDFLHTENDGKLPGPRSGRNLKGCLIPFAHIAIETYDTGEIVVA